MPIEKNLKTHTKVNGYTITEKGVEKRARFENLRGPELVEALMEELKKLDTGSQIQVRDKLSKIIDDKPRSAPQFE